MRRIRSKRKSSPSLRPDFADRRIQPPRPVLTAEFAHHVVGARHAHARHVGIEQERPPDQFESDIRAAAQRAHQPPHAQVAPRADEIMHDLDMQPGFRGCQDIHGGSVALSRRNCHVAIIDHAVDQSLIQQIGPESRQRRRGDHRTDGRLIGRRHRVAPGLGGGHGVAEHRVIAGRALDGRCCARRSPRSARSSPGRRMPGSAAPASPDRRTAPHTARHGRWAGPPARHRPAR